LAYFISKNQKIAYDPRNCTNSPIIIYKNIKI